MERKGKVKKKKALIPEGVYIHKGEGSKNVDAAFIPATIKYAGKEVKVTEKEETAFNKEIEAEQKEAEKLPIDKLVDIAVANELIVEATPEARWHKFIEGIRLYDIVYDCLQSSMNQFCEAYNKKNPKENLQLKLLIRNKKQLKGNQVAGCTLALECRKEGNYFILVEKHVSFTHVREIKEEASWKYALYGEMFNLVVAQGLSYMLIQYDFNTGRIKPEVPA